MALLSMQGFEGMGEDNTNPADAVVGRRNMYVSNPEAVYVVDGRYGGKAIRYTHVGAFVDFYGGPSYAEIGSEATKIWGFSFYNRRFLGWDGTYPFCRWRSVSPDSDSCELKIYRNGMLQLLDKSGSVIAKSSRGVIHNDQWHDLQVKLTYGASGSCEIKVDDVTVINETGIDTTATGGSSYHGYARVYSFLGNTFYSPFFDDFWCCDTTGNTNNDFLSTKRILGYLPTGDDTSEWTPSTGNDHYAVVDENPPDDSSTYISSSSGSGDLDLFTHASILSDTSNINGVKVAMDVALASAGSENTKQAVESGNTVYYGSNHTIDSTSWGYRNYYWETDPDTGNLWTVNGFNNAKFGVEMQ